MSALLSVLLAQAGSVQSRRDLACLIEIDPTASLPWIIEAALHREHVASASGSDQMIDALQSVQARARQCRQSR